MMPDFIADFIMPSLIAKTLAEAPGVRLEIAEWRGARTLSRDYLDTIDLMIISGWVERFPGFTGELLLLVDTWLKTTGGWRHVVLKVPTYLLALAIVAETDLVAVVPKQLVERLGARFGVRSMALPVAPGDDEIFLHHPSSAAGDPGSAWLRAAVRSLN